MDQSVPQMPVSFTRMSTSSSPMRGTGTCFTAMTPGFSKTAAFMVVAMVDP